MKHLSSKQAKAKSISPETKMIVFERDGRRCIYCGSLEGLPNAHFIPRSLGGLGIEQNIITLCLSCHDRYDRGGKLKREGMKEFFREYLQSCYPDWDESKLYYHKEDY